MKILLLPWIWTELLLSNVAFGELLGIALWVFVQLIGILAFAGTCMNLYVCSNKEHGGVAFNFGR